MVVSGELGQFFRIALGTVAIAVPLMLHKIRLPRRLQRETLSDNQLTDKQREFLAVHSSKLKDLGYTPFVTYRVTNIPGSKNLLRTYVSSTDPSRCTVQITGAGNGPVQFNHVQFTTDFADKSEAMTTNRTTVTAFDPEPNKFVQECRGISDIVELKQRHDRFTESYRRRGPVFTDTKTYFDMEDRKYENQVVHQVRQKLLRFDPVREEYRVTTKWALRTQRYMFNPFADKLTPLKVAAALTIAALPVVVSLQHAQILHWLGPSASLDGGLGLVSLPTLSYMISGVAAGLLFEHKSFVWAFLLACIPTLFLPPVASHTIGMSFLMGCVADVTFRVRGRSKRIV